MLLAPRVKSRIGDGALFVESLGLAALTDMRRPGSFASKRSWLYDAIENGVADLADPMLKDRIAELKAIRDQAHTDAERAEGALERVGPSITPQSLKTFARQARKRLRTESGGYRRDYALPISVAQAAATSVHAKPRAVRASEPAETPEPTADIIDLVLAKTLRDDSKRFGEPAEVS